MNRNHWLALLGSSLAAITTTWRVAMSDTLAAMYPAWNLLHHGSMIVTGIHGKTAEEIHHGISDRMPGMIWALVPFSFMPHPSVLSFILAAFIVNGLTIFVIAKTMGFNAGLLATFATPLVYVNKAFWPQSIDILLILLAIAIVTRYWQGRLAYWLIPIGIAVTITRPPTFALLLGVVFLMSMQRFWNTIYTVIGGVIGAAILLIFTHHYFGIWSLRGGYGLTPLTHESFIHTLAVGIISPQRGILFYTPWLVFAFLWDRRITRRQWNEVAILAFLYVIAEWKVYTAFGGNGYLGYRYALPFAVLAIPAALRGMRRCRPVAVILLSWSVGVNLYAFFVDRYQFTNDARNPYLVPPFMLITATVTMIVGSLVWTYTRPKKVTMIEP